MNELNKLSATALVSKIKSGEFSSEDVVRAYLNRIAEVEPKRNACKI